MAKKATERPLYARIRKQVGGALGYAGYDNKTAAKSILNISPQTLRKRLENPGKLTLEEMYKIASQCGGKLICEIVVGSDAAGRSA